MRFLRRSFCSTNLATSSRAKPFPVGVEHALDLVRWAREEETQRRETRRVESRRCQDFPLHQHAFIARPGKEREENPTRHLAGNKASSDYVLGRLLGLDVGTSRVGVAVTDASFTFAIPLGAIDRVPQRILQKQQRQLQQRSAINYGGHGRTRASRYGEIAIGSFAAQLEALARRYRCCGCVVGWPLELSGREGWMCREVVTFLRHLQPFFSDTRDQKQPSGAESGSITAPLSLPFVLVDERYSTAEALEPMYEMTRRSARGGAGRAFRRLSSRSTSSSPPKQTPPGVAPAYSAALHGKESHRRDSHAAATILQRVLDAAPDLSTLAVDDDDVSDDMP